MILVLLILLQGAIGFGIIRRVPGFRPVQTLSLSLLAGLPASSVLVIAIDLVGVRLTAPAIIAVLILGAILLNLGAAGRTRAALNGPWPKLASLRACEVVFLLLIAGFAATSLWQCIRLPVIARDMTVGADLVAKYAILEGRINSSIFTGEALRGQLSNQPYYAPFTMLMQIAYRLAGAPFGQIWLSVLFLPFLVYIYSRLRDRTHPLLAGFLVLSLTTVPLMVSYSYLLNTDFPNALFFGLGALFLHDSRTTRSPALLVLGSLFMAFACWSRSDTIVYVVPGMLLIPAGHAWITSRRISWRSTVKPAGASLLAPVLLFLLWHLIYLRWIFPDAPRVAALASGAEGRELLATIGGVAALLDAHDLYGTILYLFGATLVVNAAVFRDRGGATLLAWVAILLVGFVAVVQIFPAAYVESTVKRGFFKLFPIMIAYMGESRLFAFFSRKLENWESGTD
jgi:hypothetical protein